MPKPEPASRPQIPISHPLRILLVEDHPNTREVLTRLLKRQGHTVLSAESVESALNVADHNQVDIAISDLGLPDGSGLDLMPTLKSRYGLKGIAVSGYGMEGDFERSRQAGFGAHLVKPIDFKQLQVALQEVVDEPPPAERANGG
ncbi:MAG: response regulator [Verrucomicrobiaceae bacterium]|nr:MAG: response regulator [Verrucomicrobiaceae bacterium]